MSFIHYTMISAERLATSSNVSLHTNRFSIQNTGTAPSERFKLPLQDYLLQPFVFYSRGFSLGCTRPFSASDLFIYPPFRGNSH